MSSDDHLNNEVSVAAEVNQNGVTATVRSRFASAVDRLGGNLVDLLNATIEAPISRRRATTAGELQLLEAAARFGVLKIGADPEFAERTLENHYRKLAKSQQNKDEVLKAAIEDLRNDSTEVGTNKVEPELGEEFLTRFEPYAEMATTEELRQRWGRVLAAEVRSPGQFSHKALRIVDELDGTTAEYFERLCASRFVYSIPKALVGDLPFVEYMALTSAGLLAEQGPGQLRTFELIEVDENHSLWCLLGNRFGLAYDKNKTSPRFTFSGPIRTDTERPSTPVYVLTDVGFAISRIIDNNEENVVDRLIESLSPYFPDGGLIKLNPEDS